MMKSRVWSEEVFFIECPDPECGELEELGSGVVVRNGAKHRCVKCGVEFELETDE